MEGILKTSLLGVSLALASAALMAHASFADCFSTTSGPVVVEVLSCAGIDPATRFKTAESELGWLRDLDGPGRKALYDSYRGLEVNAQVVFSEAKQHGISEKAGALYGKKIKLFIPPGGGNCQNLPSPQVGGNLQEICCTGGGEPPCLLGTSYVLKDLKAASRPTSQETANQSDGKSENVAMLSKANELYNAHKYEQAAHLFEKLRAAGELDLVGLWHLGFAYRKLDECPNAIVPLKAITDKSGHDSHWLADEKTIRSATFLLARCFALTQNVDGAMYILNSYLLEPKKYHQELVDAVNHKDFGPILTTKEYIVFRKDAMRKLREGR